MTNQEFLQEFFYLLQKLVSQHLIKKEYGLLGYSEHDNSVFWNNTLLHRPVQKSELGEIEKEYRKLLRQPTVSFENSEKFESFKSFLTEQSFTKAFEDTWLFFEQDEIDRKGFASVKKVTSEKELEVFIATFNKCYQSDDPQNPYGEQGNYLEVIRKSWEVHNGDDAVECFIVYDRGKPVAVSTLNNFNDLGYISNVGSLREVRGKGFGKLATLYCVWVAKQKKRKLICLATEEGTYPHEFYQRIGFRKKFSALGYTKSL